MRSFKLSPNLGSARISAYSVPVLIGISIGIGIGVGIVMGVKREEE